MTTAQDNLRKAILSGDAAAIQQAAVALTQEPILELAGQIEGLRALIGDLEATRADLLPVFAAQKADVAEAERVVKEALKQQLLAHNAIAKTDSKLHDIRQNIARHQARIEHLESEIERLARAASAPVVHDLRFQ